MIKDQNMELAIIQAKKAAERDEVPVGAIIHDASGSIIAKGSNKTIKLCDPTAHAEILAIMSVFAAMIKSLTCKPFIL